MALIPLSDVSQQLRSGFILPWGVCDSHGALLLARGHVIADERSLEALLQRGAFIESSEVAGARPVEVARESLSNRWAALEARLAVIYQSPADPTLLPRIREAARSIATLPDGNVDLLIFLIMRHDHSRLMHYGTTHSLHTAALCSLLTRRLGWTEERRLSAIGAALTMNLSMIDLQGRLATRASAPSDAERALIQEHPLASGEILRGAGLDDGAWLDAVQQHHEELGGSGYPHHLPEPCELARMLHFVDCFTAKHSPRVGRKPQPAQKAARDLYLQSKGDQLAGLVIKEFGIYPPGCYVKLESGEMAIVVQRGVSANTPVVAAITNRNGDPLGHPARRDTSLSTHRIIGTVDAQSVMVRVSVEALYDRHANL